MALVQPFRWLLHSRLSGAYPLTYGVHPSSPYLCLLGKVSLPEKGYVIQRRDAHCLRSRGPRTFLACQPSFFGGPGAVRVVRGSGRRVDTGK